MVIVGRNAQYLDVLTYLQIHNMVYAHNQRFIMALKHPLVDIIYGHCMALHV